MANSSMFWKRRWQKAGHLPGEPGFLQWLNASPSHFTPGFVNPTALIKPPTPVQHYRIGMPGPCFQTTALGCKLRQRQVSHSLEQIFTRPQHSRGQHKRISQCNATKFAVRSAINSFHKDTFKTIPSTKDSRRSENLPQQIQKKPGAYRLSQQAWGKSVWLVRYLGVIETIFPSWIWITPGSPGNILPYCPRKSDPRRSYD